MRPIHLHPYTPGNPVRAYRFWIYMWIPGVCVCVVVVVGGGSLAGGVGRV